MPAAPRYRVRPRPGPNRRRPFGGDRWHEILVHCSKTAQRAGAGNSGSQHSPELLEADVVAMPLKVAVVAGGERISPEQTDHSRHDTSTAARGPPGRLKPGIIEYQKFQADVDRLRVIAVLVVISRLSDVARDESFRLAAKAVGKLTAVFAPTTRGVGLRWLCRLCNKPLSVAPPAVADQQQLPPPYS